MFMFVVLKLFRILCLRFRVLLIKPPMLPKKARVTRPIFSEILKGSRVSSSPFITLRVRLINGPEQRFSFVVPKSVSKKAVTRNLMKRRGYSVIKKRLAGIRKGVYCVFFLKKGVEKLKYQEFEREIEEVMKVGRITT